MYRLSQIAVLLLLAVVRLSAQSPHGAAMTLDCAHCHNPADWTSISTTIRFDHDTTDFPLVGTHDQVDCRSCHPTLIFSEAPHQCIACHTDVHSMSVGDDCARCHTPENWLVNDIPEIHEQNGFPLVGAHGVLSCSDCHTSETGLRFDRVGNDCVSCHMDDFQRTRSPDHSVAGFSTDCVECHDPMGTGWATVIVDHDFFPLIQGHAINDCSACHASGIFSGTSPECVSCHLNDHATTTNLPHQAAGFSTDCATCHTTAPGWAPATYDHDTYPLVGSHTTVSCDQCHNGNYTNTPNTCNGCHLPDYNGATNPDHVTAGFGTDCAQCHDETAWSPSSYDHSSYPLVGSHTAVSCDQCHSGDYNNTPNTCNGCHLPDYNSATNPDHVTAGFGTDCAQCHNESAWSPSSYDHSSYPLVGSHTAVSCDQCHNGNYNNTPNTCNGCHLPDYNRATNPDHVTAGFGTDCAQCHDETAWSPSSYDHSSYPLLGSHTSVSCDQCHNGNYNNTPNTCAGCHMTDFNTTTDPNHVTAQFGTDCLQCHDETAWDPSTFDHGATQFPLTGEHIGVSCIACHANGYVGTPTSCESCHMAEYNGTTDPNHVAAGFPTDCAQCHDETGWGNTTFDHNTTQFPLTGEHVGVSCIDCHANGYEGTPTSCESCHMPEYNGTTDPDHVAAGFPTDCAQCHDETGWGNTTFDHNSTDFPLTGSHMGVNCVACHANGYQGTPTNCDACHMADYNSTTSPNHVTAQFPVNCGECHGVVAWTPAAFDHGSTGFPLVGQHVGVSCVECHATGYDNTPTACSACHMPDYNTATDPNHSAAQFPTDCAQCHMESGWTPSTFDHDGDHFPIYSGNHNGEWNTCADCHTNPNNYSVFTCVDCHEHDDPTEVNNDHDGVNGYTYTSSACYNCHPDGSN